MRYKLVLKDMAMELSKAKGILKNNSDSFAEHFTKIAIYKNSTNDLNGWIRTLAIICTNVGNIPVKTKSGKLSEKDYLEYFFNSINDYKDLRQNYYSILLKGFSEVENAENKESLNNWFNIYKELKTLLLTKFLQNEDLTLSQYKSLITDFFNVKL